VRLSTAYLAKYALVERLERPKDSAGKDSTLGGKGAAPRRNRDINWLKTLLSNKILEEIFIPAELHKCGEQNFTSICVCLCAVQVLISTNLNLTRFPTFFFDFISVSLGSYLGRAEPVGEMVLVASLWSACTRVMGLPSLVPTQVGGSDQLTTGPARDPGRHTSDSDGHKA
jgi:hypothetical protein